MDSNLKLQEIFEKAKSDKKILKHLKNAFVCAEDYDFASHLREIETTNFPQSEAEKELEEAREILAKSKQILNRLDIGTRDCFSYRIYKGFEMYFKNNNLQPKQGSRLIADSIRLFSGD